MFYSWLLVMERRNEDSPWSFREKSMLVTIIILAGISVLIMAIYFKFNIRKYERWNYFIHYIEGNVNDRNEISSLWNRPIKTDEKNPVMQKAFLLKIVQWKYSKRSCLNQCFKKFFLHILQRTMTQKIFVMLVGHEYRRTIPLSDNFKYTYKYYSVSLVKKLKYNSINDVNMFYYILLRMW